MPGSVSVITAAYNSEDLLAEAVLSVAAQSHPVLEHIVVDDGSSDGTRELVEELRRSFSHLVYIRQPHSGAASARNAGIEAATGRYIAFLDSDDTWRAHKLEAQIGFMVANDAPFTYGDYAVVRGCTKQICAIRRPPESLRYDDLLLGCPIGCLTASFDQEAIGKAYMPPVRRGQDWGLWLAITRRGIVARKYPGLAADYRMRGGSLSGRKWQKSLDLYRIYREHEGLGPSRSLYLLARHSLGVVGRLARLKSRAEARQARGRQGG